MSGRSYAKLLFSRKKPEHCEVCGLARKKRKVGSFMKKVLLVVALLLLATPVFAADVTITATPVGGLVDTVQKVTIGYTGAAEANSISAFALSIKIDNTADANIQNIADFKRGESTTGNLGYGIFPAKFRQYIQVQNPTTADWADLNYTPLAEWGDANCGWGIGTKWIVTELGTLYTGSANAPGTSGTLFSVDVNGYGDCNLCVELEQTRGGVVKKDTTGATVDLPPGGGSVPAGCIKVTLKSLCSTPSNQVGNSRTAAIAAWTTEGFTNLVGTPVTGCPADNVVTNDQLCIDKAAALNYTYNAAQAAPASVTVPAADADGNYVVSWTAAAGATSYQLESSAPASGTTIFPLWVQIYSGTALTFNDRVGGGTWSYRVKATNACSQSSGYTTGGTNCVVANCLVGGAAGTAENPDWVKWRYPACWCYARQCRGDINGKKTGPNYVQLLDFSALTAAFGKTDVQMVAIPSSICADLNHKKTGPNRVQLLDYTILTTYFGKADALVPLCTAAPVINGPWNYNTVP